MSPTYRSAAMSKPVSKRPTTYFEDHYSSPHINNAQLEPRVAVGMWEGDKLTVYASTQGIANCRTDIAKDLNMPAEKVRVICLFMGGGFGNKNQNHDFDLMAAVLSKKAGVPVKLEFTRKEDFISVHGRWPTKQYYKVGVKNDGTLTAIQLRGYSNMGPYRKGQGDIAGIEGYKCPNTEKTTYMVYTNMAVSANLRGPAYPQGVFAIESMMDHIAFELKIDPVEFRLKNMTRKLRDEVAVYQLRPGRMRRARSGGVRLEKALASARRRRRPREDGRRYGHWHLWFGHRAQRRGPQARFQGNVSPPRRRDRHRHRRQNHHGPDCRRRTGRRARKNSRHQRRYRYVPLLGGRVRQPYDDPHGLGGRRSGQRTQETDRRKGFASGNDEVRRVAISTDPKLNALARNSFVAHFAQVEVDIETGHIRVTDFLGAHDSGRIINPLTAESQVKGGVTMGLGMALHEELRYDKRTGLPIKAGYYGARILTHMDTPEVRVLFAETEDPYGPFGAKTIGELTIIPTVAAVANAVFNAIGKRVKDLPITRERVLEVLA